MCHYNVQDIQYEIVDPSPYLEDSTGTILASADIQGAMAPVAQMTLLCNDNDTKGAIRGDLLSLFDIDVQISIHEIPRGYYDLTIWVRMPAKMDRMRETMSAYGLYVDGQSAQTAGAKPLPIICQSALLKEAPAPVGNDFGVASRGRLESFVGPMKLVPWRHPTPPAKSSTKPQSGFLPLVFKRIPAATPDAKKQRLQRINRQLRVDHHTLRVTLTQLCKDRKQSDDRLQKNSEEMLRATRS